VASTAKERAGKLAAKVPTKWILAGLAAVLLAASALFGGLNDAPVEPIPQLDVGDTSNGTRVDLSVERAIVIDGFPDINLEPEPGFRYLVIIATAENVWPTPVPQVRSFVGSPQPATVLSPRIEGLEGTAPEEILVFSDATDADELQPGVPVQLAYLWQVPADELAEGDIVGLDLWDEAYLGDARISFGELFDDPAIIGTMDVDVDDVAVVESDG
jgi:hypothetical protein